MNPVPGTPKLSPARILGGKGGAESIVAAQYGPANINLGY